MNHDSIATPSKPSKSKKRPNTKRTGELAEAAFVVKAAGLGFAVSKPWGDSERYDFILDAGHRTFRVQVKCTESLHANAYQVQSTYTDRNRKGHYTATDIDVLVGYVLPLDLWYVVPVHALPESASLRFYPHGCIAKRARFEQYREAWQFFREPLTSPTAARSTPDRTTPSFVAEPEGREDTPLPDPSANDVQSDEAVSPFERTMTDWAKRVNALYNRNR